MGRTRTLARLSDRFYWSGMSDDVKDWLGLCVACIKRKSPVGRHHLLGNIPTAPVIAGIVLPWTSWTSVTLHRRDSDTSC